MRFVKTIRLSSQGPKVLVADIAATVCMLAHDILANLKLKERVASMIKFDANGNTVELDISEADLDWLYVE